MSENSEDIVAELIIEKIWLDAADEFTGGMLDHPSFDLERLCKYTFNLEAIQ